MTATVRKEMKVSQHEIQFLCDIKNTFFFKKKKRLIYRITSVCVFIERQTKVQFCTESLSQVIHYETNR